MARLFNKVNTVVLAYIYCSIIWYQIVIDLYKQHHSQNQPHQSSELLFIFSFGW